MMADTVLCVYRVCFVALLTLAIWTGGGAQAANIKTVATFSILGDMVRQVGGDRLDVVTLVGPDQDVHVYEPTPRDVAAMAASGVDWVKTGIGPAQRGDRAALASLAARNY